MLSARDLPLLPVFTAVASTGSFTAAARQLGLGKSVVSQHVKTLEERCGVRLIERSTRRMHLTQVGEQVLDAAHAVLSSFRTLEQVVEGQRERPSGTLRVTCPLDIGLSRIVASVVADLTRSHPALKVDLLFDDAVHDLVEKGLDVALRLNSPAESSYVARRLAAIPEIVVGSPSFIDSLDLRDEPERLNGAPWIAHTMLRPRSTWTLRSERGEKLQVRVDLRVTANTVVAVRDLLLAGAGLAVLPSHMVHDDLRAGRLRHLCRGWTHRKLSLLALMPTRNPPPRVRVFLSGLSAAIADHGLVSAS